MLAAADDIDTEFGLFLRVLLYTGMRLGEATSIRLTQVDLERAAIYLPKTKNNEVRRVSSAARYEHLDATEEAQKAKLFASDETGESGGK